VGDFVSRAALAAAIAFTVAACGPTPTPSPEDMTGVLNEFAAHGATVKDVVAGDAGCADPSLHGNASRLTLTLAADGRDYAVYLFRWRRPSDYEAANAAFQQCVAEFADDHSTDVELVEVSPWRAFGAGWTFDAKEVIEQSLVAAAGGGS
jgi:hypothetical protein